MTERIDIYDCDRLPTGRTADCPRGMRKGEYRLVIHLCLFDDAGRMLIQKRQDTCARWPGLWDVSVRGCADAGETGRMAAEREAREELGLSLDLSGVRPALAVSFPHGYDELYLADFQMPPLGLCLQREEVAEIRWASEDEILRLREEGLFTPFRPDYLRLLFRLREFGDVMEPESF